MPKKKRKLTEAEWAEVFRLRCRSKKGEFLPPDQSKLCREAFLSDEDRYGKMEREVFQATKPFGAS